MYKKRTRSYHHFFLIERHHSNKQDRVEKENKKKINRNKSIFNSLYIGQIVKGKVYAFNNYGAIIEFKGIFGFLHISEISNKWINHPTDVLKIGETLKLKIISKDIDNKDRISVKLTKKNYDNLADEKIFEHCFSCITNIFSLLKGKNIRGISGKIVRIFRKNDNIYAIIELREKSSTNIKHQKWNIEDIINSKFYLHKKMILLKKLYSAESNLKQIENKLRNGMILSDKTIKKIDNIYSNIIEIGKELKKV